jgi:hypothetical protein
MRRTLILKMATDLQQLLSIISDTKKLISLEEEGELEGLLS